MANEILKRDQNSVPVLAGITDDSSQEIRMLRVDPSTGRLLVSGTGGGGGSVLTPTGTVNGSNTSFGVASQPSIVFYDGVCTVEGVGYTYDSGGSTIKMFIAPAQFIRYI